MAMPGLRNLLVRGGADFSAMHKAFRNTNKTFARFQRNMGTTTKLITASLATLSLGAFVTSAVKGAMEVEAAMQQIDRTMGESADEFKRWSKETALSFNMGSSTALKYGGIYSNLLTTFTKDTAQTMSYSQDLLKSSAIVASSTGRSMEDVMWRIRSGLLGNTEAIEDLGVNIYVNLLESTQAFKRFAGDKSWNELDFQTQQTIRYFGILEQVSTKFGDKVRDNTSSRLVKLTEVLKDVRVNIGFAFTPILYNVLPILTQFSQKLLEVTNTVAQFSKTLFGTEKKEDQLVQVQADRVENLGDAYEEAGKKAKGSVAGFDEINQLSLDTPENSPISALPSEAVSSSTTPKTKEETEGLSDKLLAKVNELKPVLASVTAYLKEMGGYLAVIAQRAYAEFFVPVGGALANAFTPFVTKALDTIKSMVSYLAGDGFYWVKIFLGLFTAWQSSQFVIAMTNATIAFAKNTVAIISNTIAFYANIVAVIRNSIAITVNLVVALARQIKMIWATVAALIVEALVLNGATIGTYALALASSILSAALAFLTSPITLVIIAIGALIAAGVLLYKNWDTVKEVAKKTFDFLGKHLGGTADNLKNIVDGIKKTFNGLINFITGVFTGNWKKAWGGIKDIFVGIFETLYSVLKAPLLFLIDMINLVIRGVNSINFKVPEWVPGVGGKDVGFNIPEIPKFAQGGIVDANSPMLAMVGDNKTQKEAIAPIDDLMSMVSSAVLTAMQATSNRTGDIVLNIDGVAFARVTNAYNAKETTRIGANMIRVT